MTWRRLPGLGRRTRRRVLVAVGVGLAGELGALGLLTTGAWLLLSASLRPPILLLSIAIGAVQLFSFLRGTARYVERLASHNLGLGLQAGVRSWLYRRLELLLPAGLPGGDRGDLLARLIGDTEEAQDLVVRAAVPVLAAAGAWCAAVVTAALLLPAAAWAILAAGVLATAGVTVTTILAGRRRRHFRPHGPPSARGSSGPSPVPRNWPPSAPGSGPSLSWLSASERSAPAPGPSPPPSGSGGGFAYSQGAPGWPGSPGRAWRLCGPGGSTPLTSACWSSWPWG